MTKPVTITNTFSNATNAIPLSQLDANFSNVVSNMNDAATYSNYAADSGTANSYAVTLSGVTTTYASGLGIQFRAANTNTGASTLNVNGQGAQSIVLTSGSSLPANTIVANSVIGVMHDGTNFQLVSGGQVTTLTNPTVTNYTETVFSANSSTAITLNLANGTFQNITLTNNTTITMPTATAGKSFVLLLSQDATGSRSVNWSTVSWPSSVAPAITSTANKKDLLSFFSDGTNWYGVTVSQNY